MSQISMIMKLLSYDQWTYRIDEVVKCKFSNEVIFHCYFGVHPQIRFNQTFFKIKKSVFGHNYNFKFKWNRENNTYPLN